MIPHILVYCYACFVLFAALCFCWGMAEPLMGPTIRRLLHACYAGIAVVGMCSMLVAMAFTLLAALPSPADAQPPSDLIINGQGTATLSWTLPTMRVDGSAITADEIASIGIFFGDASRFTDGTTLRTGCTATPSSLDDKSCYPSSVSVAGGKTSDALTLELTKDTTIYFAAVAIDTGGLISAYSNEASKAFHLVLTSPPTAPTLDKVQLAVQCTTNYPQITCAFTVQ